MKNSPAYRRKFQISSILLYYCEHVYTIQCGKVGKRNIHIFSHSLQTLIFISTSSSQKSHQELKNTHRCLKKILFTQYSSPSPALSISLSLLLLFILYISLLLLPFLYLSPYSCPFYISLLSLALSISLALLLLF